MADNIKEIRYQVGEAWKGAYNAATSYSLAAVVQDAEGLSVYRSLKSGNAGHALTDTAWWMKIIDLSTIKAESDTVKELNDDVTAAEQERKEAEAARKSVETARQTAEGRRVEAEQTRNSSETERIQQESTRRTAEAQRESNEQSRVRDEGTREAKEAERQQKETARQNAETQRQTAENNRASAEQTRISDENLRREAEQGRAAAEASRVQAEEKRATDFEQGQEDRQTAYTEAETARQTAYTTAETARNQAYSEAEQGRDAAFTAAEETRDKTVDDKVGDITQLQEQVAALQAVVADIETIAEGYVRVAGSSNPALSYKTYKYHVHGGFGRESAFTLFYPCLVGTKLTGDDEQVGTVLHVLKKLGARLATEEDGAEFTEGQAVWDDIYGHPHAIDGSEGDVLICNIEPYYAISGRHTIEGTEYDVFLRSRTPFTWQGIDAEEVERFGWSPDYCVSHQDEDGVQRTHSVYNPAWNGSYTAPDGVVGRYVCEQDAETGEITETFDADGTLLGGAGGLHTTNKALYTGEQEAMNHNPDPTETVPFMNQTAEGCNLLQGLLLAEGGTFDAHNAARMGSGYSANDGATAAADWEASGSGAKNGMRIVDKDGTPRYYSLSETIQAWTGKSSTFYAGQVINSWRSPWHVMEAHRAVSWAVLHHVGELEWFVFEGARYKYRSVQGFAGPQEGEMTCVVWKMLSGQLGANVVDPTDKATSIAGNRVDFLVSTALLHGMTTQVSPSWWTSGLVFLVDEAGNYDAYVEREQSALLKTVSGDFAEDSLPAFATHYRHIGTFAKGSGYAKNYQNDALMMPDTNANKSGAGLHTYVGKYNWLDGTNAPAGKRSVRGFRRGGYAAYSILSPLSLNAPYSPSGAYSYIGFGTCARLR